ncbi:MAG: tetratricopeptide repeat protein [Myxococcota bacterium]
MSEKLTRKELKQPDAFQKAGGEAGAWLVQHQKAAVLLVVALLLGGAGVALANYFSGRGEAKASKELGAHLSLLGRPVEGQGAVEPGSEPPFKTAQEKDEAIIQALTGFRASHAETKAASIAALTLGQALLRQEKPDEAIAAFHAYLKGATMGDPLRAAALEGRGYALELKGQLDEALAAFDQMARENRADFLQGMGLYHRARILVAQGKKDEAAKQLSEIPAVAPNSSAARLATDRMALLAAEGVKVPPPQAPAADAG